MTTAHGRASSQLTDSLRAEAQANIWRGPIAKDASCSTSSSSLTVKPAAPFTRNLKRKPTPKIPTELLQDPSLSIPTTAALTSVLGEKSLKAGSDAKVTSTPSTPEPVKSAQQPQQQYILNIDEPVTFAESNSAADNAVQQLLRSASVSPASASTAAGARTRKGPLRWMQDKEEHTPAASTSTLPPRQPALARKTSLSAHLKLLRRNKSENQPAPITISRPTNFVHVATGTDGACASAGAQQATSLRRASTTSRVSDQPLLRSNMSSNYSTSSYVSRDTSPSATEKDAANEDKPLFVAMEKKHPLRPLKSIRRPSKPTLKPDEPAVDVPAGSTGPKDKRKAIYASSGSVPAILEPINVTQSSSNRGAKLSPIVSPVGSQAGKHFAAALDHTLGRTRGLSSEGGELSPEPDLSRSPGSGYESSAYTSNRSSFGSLHEFKSFLDFPDTPMSRRNSEKGRQEEDIWSGVALTFPVAGRF
ncbi:uncharacterized protein UDID_02862 [Ustilago sp. UG-2017a]|nr:uncharacterized protein UDID_02862 [Ustilago sp. UG-2017a]